MSYFIGIDPGNSCGWAVLDEEGNRIDSGTWNLTKLPEEGSGLRFIRFENLLKELLSKYPESTVSYDMVQPYGSGVAIALYYKIVGRMESYLDEFGVKYFGVRPAQYKKLATGKGNAQKDSMVEHAIVRWNDLPEKMKHDEADALWIAEFLRKESIEK